MIDKEQAQHITDVAGECNRLNEISQRVTLNPPPRPDRSWRAISRGSPSGVVLSVLSLTASAEAGLAVRR